MLTSCDCGQIYNRRETPSCPTCGTHEGSPDDFEQEFPGGNRYRTRRDILVNSVALYWLAVIAVLGAVAFVVTR